VSFDPVERRKAIWATDARKIADGRAVQVYLEKRGEVDPPDLSDIEAVQMGHVMQPVIGRLTEDRLGIRLKDMDVAVQHPTENWMWSHFDFITQDGDTLVEAKNYHSMARNKFGDNGSDHVPNADYHQCLHEATVLGVNKVILAVLFGGNEFCTFPLEFSAEDKDRLIKTEAELWARIQAGNPPEAGSADDLRRLYPMDNADRVEASGRVEQACAELAKLKAQIKSLEDYEEELSALVQSYMKQAAELVTYDGRVIATWKTAKPSKRFSADTFKQAMPDIYQQFVIEQTGSRRFLVKGA
jgi:predicted phage-related endonuclease